jgi:type II secretory pathway component PulF
MADVVQAFRYRGTDTHGKRVAGQIDATSRDEAVRRLRQSAIVPIELTAGAAREGALSPAGTVKRTTKTRAAITRAISELPDAASGEGRRSAVAHHGAAARPVPADGCRDGRSR